MYWEVPAIGRWVWAIDKSYLKKPGVANQKQLSPLVPASDFLQLLTVTFEVKMKQTRSS